MPDRPIIPGPIGDGYNMMEVAFHNGEAHMKEKAVSTLMEYQTSAGSKCHGHIGEIIRLVEGL